MVWLTQADLARLALASALLSPLLARGGWRELLRYARRSRWLLLVLWLAQMWSYPGHPLWRFWGVDGPSQAGLLGASLAVWRLVLMLAALAVLMARLQREELLLGIYTLLQPLRVLRISPQRIAVRIWLTMHYAETLLHESHGITLQQRIAQLREPPVIESMRSVELKDRPVGWRDVYCLSGALALGIGVKWLLSN